MLRNGEPRHLVNELDHECQLLLQLQERPELLDRIQRSTEPELKLQDALRSEYAPDLVRAAVTLCELRRKATSKFSLGERLWLDRQGLEQSTPEFVARHKAMRFAEISDPILDLCTGIGSDAIAMAGTGIRVESFDLSAVACLRAELNAGIYGVRDRISFHQGNVRNIDIRNRWVHIDPDRRQGQRRASRIEDYEPPLEFLQELTERARGGAIKLSPASNFGGKFSNCEIELISLDGECKEATVWFGDLATEHDWRATILPAGYTLSGNPHEHYPHVTQLQDYIYDPDPAIVRSGLLDALVDQAGFSRIDDAEEFLTSSTLVESPATTAFEVLANLANNPREIRKYFREHPVGEVEIKCRHVPTNADQLRKKLPLAGEGRATLFIAREGGRTRAIIARRIASARSGADGLNSTRP